MRFYCSRCDRNLQGEDESREWMQDNGEPLCVECASENEDADNADGTKVKE